MREIRFRAWSTKSKELLDTENMHMNPATGKIMFDEDNSCSDTECCGGPCPYWVDNDDYIVMQYTGLKDKNSVEIYEGDIVRTSLYGRRDCEVMFTKAGFYLLVDTGIGTNLFEMSDIGMEIIGNIYEHPELLGR